jgi:hypothetical protein
MADGAPLALAAVAVAAATPHRSNREPNLSHLVPANTRNVRLCPVDNFLGD